VHFHIISTEGRAAKPGNNWHYVIEINCIYKPSSYRAVSTFLAY